MAKQHLEPGLLTVFRGVAVLRLVLFSLVLLFQQMAPAGSYPAERFSESNRLPTFLVVAEVSLLVGFLFWSGLQKKLGGWYLPLALAIATTGMIVEQHFFSPTRSFWQPQPFITILVILVAWQYTFREVLYFSLGSTALQTVLILFFPQPYMFPPNPFINDGEYNMGRLATSTLSYLFLGYIVSSLMNAQRQQRRDLAEANRKLLRYALAQEQLATSRERNRLARELHDTLAHTLSALAVQLEAVFSTWTDIPGKARRMLEGMLASTRTGLDETRRTLNTLRAAPLEEMGLALAVQTLAEDLTSRQAQDLSITINGDLTEVPPEIGQCFYRVAQEALTNTVRHAQAQRVSVTLGAENSSLVMSIMDDGEGFDPANLTPEETLGLRGMKERAEMVGGNLDIDSQPGQGTRITLVVEMTP
jgi:signal transduction histidine kinase